MERLLQEKGLIGPSFIYLDILNWKWTEENAIDAMDLFVQAVFTGPRPDLAIPKQVDIQCLKWLQIDGEDPYVLTPYPSLLWIARTAPLSPRWKLRSLLLHQRILDSPSNSLFECITSTIDQIQNALPEYNDRTLVCIECAIAFLVYKDEHRAQQWLNAAQEASGFKFKLTGALGRRTKFQTFDVSQLVIEAESLSVTKDAHLQTLPTGIDLNDDTLLDKIKFKNDLLETDLSEQDQCILLAYGLMKRYHSPDDGLAEEEIKAFVTKVAEQPKKWMIHTMALLLRSRLETKKSRTIERAVLQLQALVDQYRLTDPSVKERQEYFYALLVPTIWELERELGERLMSLGVVMSALEIFERLQLWEDVVSCYQLAGKLQKAETIVQQQLEIHPNNPKLLCIMGDLKGDLTWYEKAWEVSNGRFARAMRSLGAAHFKQNNHALASECYQNALRINPLFDNSWYILGCCAMRLEDWELASTAFLRVINIDHENGEAWSNLAAVYIRQDKISEARRALKEALKVMYDNFKVWENYLYVSLDANELHDAIEAFRRVAEIKSKSSQSSIFDIELLIVTLQKILKNTDEEESTRLLSKFGQLLDYLCTHTSNSDALFKLCRDVYEMKGDYRKALEFQQKAFRILMHQPEIEHDEAKFKSVVQGALDMVHCYESLGPKQVPSRVSDDLETLCKDWQYQSRLLLRGLLGRCKDSFEGHSDYEILAEELQRLR